VTNSEARKRARGKPRQNGSRSAFVAMKFDKHSWNDCRYIAISEVLEEAGFSVARADQIRSSGEVVREVLDQLRTADLVLVDTTGDSHSVSYELGYCHGLGRDPEDLVLLRQAAPAGIPFNYSHFRHLLYRDLRHLRRLLRERLEISSPLEADQLGYVLSFDVPSGAGEYGNLVADAVLAALANSRLTGRCEYYAGEPFPGIYGVGLGVRQIRPRRALSYDWWMDLVRTVGGMLVKSRSVIRLNEGSSEFIRMESIRNDLLSRAVAEVSEGRVVRILKPFNDGEDSWFKAAAARRLLKQK
jgi:hypothetical protein